MKSLKIGFNNAGTLGDNNDISNIAANLSSSTNNTLIDGLYRRGIDEIFQFGTSQVGFDSKGSPVVDAVRFKIVNKDARKNKFESAMDLVYGNVACAYCEMHTIEIDSFDIIFVRGDDLEPDSYALAAYQRARRPLYLNTPEATLATKDKFRIKERVENRGVAIPCTYNVEDFLELTHALTNIHGEYKVVKGRYGFGGTLVWKVSSNTPKTELKRILEQCKGGVVVQEYKPIIEKGDIRVCLFDGKILGDGGILRRARDGTWKTNIDLGGSQTAYRLDARMREAAEQVGEAYSDVRFQGVDLLLDGTFLETNAYPSTLGYLRQHFGVRGEDVILDKILYEVNERR